MIPRNFPNHDKNCEKNSFQNLKKYQTLFSNLLYKFTGRNAHQVEEQVTYPTKKKKETKFHINTTNNDRHPKFCVVVDSKLTSSTKKAIPKNDQLKMKRRIKESTNIDSNTNKSQSPQTMLLNASSLSENIGCLNKLNWKKAKRSDKRIINFGKPKEFSNHSNIHVMNILNVENFFDSYVSSDNHSECVNYLKSSKCRNNSRRSLENSDKKQKNNFCSKFENKSCSDCYSTGKKYTSKTVKKENEDKKYLFRESTSNKLSSHFQAKLILNSKYKIIKKQKTCIRNMSKTKPTLNKQKRKSIQIKSDKMIKTKGLKRISSKRNKIKRGFKQKKFRNNLIQVKNFKFKYSYRIVLHQKPYYIIDDLINYSFYLSYTLTVFDKLRIESANDKINIGFDFQTIANCHINPQFTEVSIQRISPFQADTFNIYHFRSICKIQKLRIFINKMDYEFVESITEFMISDLNQIVNIQQHCTDTYYILSKSNFHKLEIIDRSSVCRNYPLEDSWDEISSTKSNSSCTIATKENKSMSSDYLYKTEDIYGSDIEMDTIPEICSDEELEDNSSIDQARPEEYDQIINFYPTNTEKINWKSIIEKNQLIDISRSVEMFYVNYGNLLIFSEIFYENYTKLNEYAILENQVLILCRIVFMFPVQKTENIFTFIIEICEKFISEEIISQCSIKVEETSLKLLILPIVNYINIDKQQFYNVLSSTNESSIRCWEIINEDNDSNNKFFINSQKAVNQLKLLMISEISISIDKSIYNFHNIIINNHEELFHDSSNNANYRCYY